MRRRTRPSPPRPASPDTPVPAAPACVLAAALLLPVGPLAGQGAAAQEGAAPATAGPPDQVEALRERGRAWLEAARSEDAAALARLYTRDAVFLPPGRPEIVGRSRIRSLFAAQFEQMDASYDFEIREIVVSGDWAFRRGAYTVRASLADGSTRTVRDKFLDVWRRGEDGRWRIARDIWNRSTSPEAGG